MVQNETKSLIDQSDDGFLELVAESIIKRGLYLPAVVILEVFQPLATLGHAALLVGSPLIEVVIGRSYGRELVKLLEDRKNFERLIVLLDQKKQSRVRVSS